MVPFVLEGDTLGKKHQYYNKLVREATTKQLLEPSQDDDIRSLLNIDLASKNRNVDYILEVLKSEDQLYVSKAIKRSTWLLTEPQYAHIINPEYLYTELYPQMTSKAFNKLMLNIRLHLKDEKRVEAFYNYFKEKNIKSAYKWLQHCSVPFVEIEVGKYNRDIPNYLAVRLFKKSFSIFETYTTGWNWMIQESMFLLRNHTDKCIDIFESFKLIGEDFFFTFSAKDTETLMKKCPQRILDKFEFYGKSLYMETFAKYLHRKENIQDFLLKHANNKNLQWLYAFEKIQHFIKLMPKENRFEFVRRVFIDKEMLVTGDSCTKDCADSPLCCWAPCNIIENTNIYQWYKFAQFDMAFTEFKKLIRIESDPVHRSSMLQVLLSCAGRNKQHIQTLLKFYHDKHINEPFKFKIQFVNFFISKVDTHTLDDQSWDILIQLFHSLEVFIESENNVQSCIKSIIVRSVIRNEQVPDIIKSKFVFDTLNTIQTKLKKQEEKDAVFKYLQDYIITKSNPLNLTIESEFNEAVTLCKHLFNLIKDWGKELRECTYALDRVKEIINVKKEKRWSRDLTTLYNTKKSWRKAMFEESIVILPTEKVCLNALKHDPGLFSRNKEQVLEMCCNDTISLRNLLKKIRIYWPESLAEEWKIAYLKRLDQPGGHKALVVGLCTLLSQEQINGHLKKFAPSETKIDWNQTDQLELSLRKQIAKNMHKIRPLPPVELILLYAKGDYLQYAVPSLVSVLSQLSPKKSRLYVPILLDSPVSLQKFGVRCAFHKLTFEEIKPMLLVKWNSTKSSSIRTVLFTHTFKLLSKEKNTTNIKDTWDLLSMFIDKLTPDEDKLVYKKLGEAWYVSDSIKPQFYKKSYTFLSSLPGRCNCKTIIDNMQTDARDFMEFLDDDFVVNVMLKKFYERFTKTQYIHDNAEVIAVFIFASKDEETQIRRYEKSVGTILEKYLPQWDMIVEDEYRIKEFIKCILDRLAKNLYYTFEKNMQFPLKVFEAILIKLENMLFYQKDYVELTAWKLVVTFVKILAETDLVTVFYKIEATDNAMTDEEKDKLYTDTHKKIAPLFAKICIQHLKEDLDRFGQSVYSLFSEAFVKCFDDYLYENCKFIDQIEYIICLLQFENEREVWLMIHKVLEAEFHNIDSDNEKRKFEEVRQIVFSHPSDEIKMHYHQFFAEVVPFTPTTTS